MKKVPISRKLTTPRKAITPGEYKNNAKRTCRVVKYPMESTSAAASSGSTLILSDSAEAFEASRSSRGRRATFRAVLQSLSNARTGTAHPAACRRCAKRAMTIECPPASANPSSQSNGVPNTALQIASTCSPPGSMLGINVRCLDVPVIAVQRADTCLPRRVLCFQLGVSV